MDYYSLERIFAQAAGLIDADGYTDAPNSSWLLVNRAVVAVISAKPVWEKPSDIENEIEEIRKDIRALVRRIEGLHHYARWKARTASYFEELDRIQSDLKEAHQSGDAEKEEKAGAELQSILSNPTPHSEWLDVALIQKLLEFEVALRRSAAAAVAAVDRAPTGRGRRPNEWAYRVALIAARFFQDATGSRPTSWTGGETPFSRFVSALYNELGIDADIRRPIERALSKLKSDD